MLSGQPRIGDVTDGVGLREIVHPKEAGVSQFDRLPQHGEETEEDRDLDHHREATAHRIDAVILVKLHHLLIHPRRVVFVFLAQLLHFG